MGVLADIASVVVGSTGRVEGHSQAAEGRAVGSYVGMLSVMERKGIGIFIRHDATVRIFSVADRSLCCGKVLTPVEGTVAVAADNILGSTSCRFGILH